MKWRLIKIQRINETKKKFFEKINKIEKPLATLAKVRNIQTQTNTIRNEKYQLHIPMTFITLGSILKTYILISWKI
jgi:hypothetical protein